MNKQVIDQTSGIAIISCEAGQVFYYHAVNFSAHYIGKEPLEVLPVGVRSCVSIVYIFGNTFKFSDMLLVKVIEQITLVDDAVAVVLSLFQVLLGEPDVCAQPPAADGIRGRETLLQSSVFCSCHCSSFPITLHLYYTSARAGQQGCLRLGTLCLEVETGHNRSYSPLFCRRRKSVSVSCKDGPLSANSIFTPIPPMQKQYGFSTACKNRAIRSSRGREVSKIIPLTSGRDSGATAPMSTLFICSSSFAVNLTVKPPYQK